jgi:dihydroflavonol-4-reductase
MMGVVYDSKTNTGTVDTKDWTDPYSKNINTYIKAKTLGEKAAWEFYNNQSDDFSMEMAVMCAGGIYGPSLTGNISGFSLKGVHQMLTGHFKMSMIPPAAIPMSDVRDVAKLHVLAMTEKRANGKRLIPTTSKAYSFMDIAKILKKNGYSKVSTKKAPIFMIKLMSLIDREAKGMVPIVGNTVSSNNIETREIFDWEPIPFEKTILDCAKSIEHLV